MRKTAIFRIRIITAFVLFFALLLVARLYYIQIYAHDLYEAKAEQQYIHTVSDLYNRGSIYFTTKDGDRVSAATIQTGYVLAMNASLIDNIEETYKRLNEIIPVDRERFFELAERKLKPYQEISQKVSNEDALKIEDLDIEGLQLYRTQWRYYPGQDLAARTVGFVGFSEESGDELTGRFGLEQYYDEILSRNAEEMSVDFFAEIFTNLGGIVFDNTPARSGDVVTSIEPTVARMLDNELEKVQAKYNSTLTGGIIINPQNGEIYAMNAVPTFDLNNRAGKTIQDFRNPLVQDALEMGSIIKPLTVASGLDAKAITPQSTYYDAGSIELNTFKISNYDGRGRGTVDMQQVLNQSLNTGVAHIVKTMGNKNFADYFRALRLGSETGIDIPFEAHGNIENLKSPRDVEYATASFGQGIALTPIATVRALSALGNGGRLVTPHIATHVVTQNGSEQKIQYPDGAQVFSPETSEEISRMLVKVVDEALRGGKVKLDNYTVGAKTGTAQIADPVNGGYYKDRFLHSFFGYFPAYEPKFLVFLYTVEPKGVNYASETLTDPFMEITKFIVNYYNLPPDR
ncbi:penicillin-binding protein 2 [Candidatus Kaiserbacteria bacterium]|nr:penicillin-binding protein 2 [Candidatus Kaiserbacteria bacterium]